MFVSLRIVWLAKFILARKTALEERTWLKSSLGMLGCRILVESTRANFLFPQCCRTAVPSHTRRLSSAKATRKTHTYLHSYLGRYYTVCMPGTIRLADYWWSRGRARHRTHPAREDTVMIATSNAGALLTLLTWENVTTFLSLFSLLSSWHLEARHLTLFCT